MILVSDTNINSYASAKQKIEKVFIQRNYQFVLELGFIKDDDDKNDGN